MAKGNHTPETKRPRRFTWRTGVAVALVTTLLCVAAIEVALRIARLHQAPATLAELEERRERFRGGDVRLGHLIMPSDDPDIVYELIPGLDVVWRDVVTSRATHVRTNCYGWRDDEWTSPKPSGQVRIAVLGDSTSFGWFIEREDNHPECLQWALNPVAGEDAVEVMNFSVPGYNSAMEKEVLRARALSHQPDIVVLQFEINDMHLPNFMKLPENVWRLDRLYLWDYLHSLHPRWKKARQAEALPELVGLDALELIEDENGARIFQLDPDRIPPEHRDMAGPENCRRHIAEIGRICRERRLPAVMLLNPILVDSYGEDESTATDPQYAPYVETAREAGFIIADPTSDIQEFLSTHHLTSRDLFVDPFTDDSHPSPPRSALMARRLALTVGH